MIAWVSALRHRSTLAPEAYFGFGIYGKFIVNWNEVKVPDYQ